MITTATAPFVLESESQKEFDGCNIICEPTYFELQDVFNVTLHVQDTSTDNFIDRGYVILTPAEVDAETGIGTGETDLWFSALQNAVITKLEAYAGNESTVFAIV